MSLDAELSRVAGFQGDWNEEIVVVVALLAGCCWWWRPGASARWPSSASTAVSTSSSKPRRISASSSALHAGLVPLRAGSDVRSAGPVDARACAPRPAHRVRCVFTVHNEILHGPVLWFSAVGLARVNSQVVLDPVVRKEVVKLFGTDDPVRVSTRIGFFGGATTTFSGEARSVASGNDMGNLTRTNFNSTSATRDISIRSISSAIGRGSSSTTQRRARNS